MTEPGSRNVPGRVHPLRARDPRQLGTYLLTGRLGEGGQGVVYLGTGPDGTRVAIKLLRSELADDEGARSRFVREVATAERVSGPFTAKVLDADVAGDRPYVVSEFVNAPSLQDLIADSGPLPPADLQRLAAGTATALAAIHASGIVHRDFKPGNVLWAPAGPKVIDFGIARALDATATLSSNVVGSPAYMAPEQFAPPDDRPAGTPADIFAWASTIAFATTSRAPFGSDDIPRIMHRILYAEPDLRGVPLPLLDLLRSCLAKDPSVRPSARQIASQLHNEADAAQQTAPPTAFPKTGNPRITFENPTVAQPLPDQPMTDSLTDGDGPRRKRIAPATIAVALTVALISTVAYVAYATYGQNGVGSHTGANPDTATQASMRTPAFPARPPAGQALPGAKAVLATALNSKLSLVAYTSYVDNRQYVWNVRKGRYVADPRLQFLGATSFSPDGRWASGLRSGTAGDRYLPTVNLSIIDRTSDKRATNIPPPAIQGRTPEGVRFGHGQWSPDSRKFIVPVYYLTDVANYDTYVGLGFLIVELGKEDEREFVNNDRRSTWRYTPDSRHLMANRTASPGKNGSPDIEFTDFSGNKVTSIPKAGWLSDHPAFSPDGSKVIADCDASADTKVHYACVWDVTTFKRVAKVPFGSLGDKFGDVGGLVTWWDDDHLLVQGLVPSHKNEAVIVDFEGSVQRTLIKHLDSIIPTFAFIQGQ